MSRLAGTTEHGLDRSDRNRRETGRTAWDEGDDLRGDRIAVRNDGIYVAERSSS